MFTGIINHIGLIKNKVLHSDKMVLTVEIHFEEEPIMGESIAINGACMTVCLIHGPTLVQFDVSMESLNKTNLKNLEVGQRVNIERSLKVGGRIDGHFVTGHVDGLGKIKEIKKNGDDYLIYFEVPEALVQGIVNKGSVAIDGISLTIIEPKQCTFHVTIVPHTLKHTILQYRKIGHEVNIETDVLGKYVLNSFREKGSQVNKTLLEKAGFLD